MPRHPKNQASAWIATKGITQRKLSLCTGQSQAGIHRQLAGLNPLSPALAVAIRTLAAAEGCSNESIELAPTRVIRSRRDLVPGPQH